MGSFIFDYNPTIRQARLLESLAEDLTYLSRHKMANLHASLADTWQGPTSTLAINFSLETQQAFQKIAQSVSKHAQALRQTANYIHDAEMQAMQVIKTITNDNSSGGSFGGGGTGGGGRGF